MTFSLPSLLLKLPTREFTQLRRRQQQERHKFAYLTVRDNSSARFASAVFIFGHFADVFVLSTTWNDLFCICVDDVSIWPQMFNFVFLYLKRWFQFNSRIVGTHFASVMTLNTWEIIAETRSYIFRWCSRYRRRRVCVNSLLRRERRRRPEDHSRTQSPSAWFWSTCGLPERLWDNGTPFSHKILNGFSKVVK